MSVQANKALAIPYPRGSEWRKWDLHAHTPGTALNDNFSSWDDFIAALRVEKEIAVFGVTDYLSIKNYERLLLAKQESKLGSIELLIPNIEFRVTPQTAKGHAINVHLLVDPTDPIHCEEISFALARLSTRYKDQPYSCTPEGIASLGRAYNPLLTDQVSRLREGVNQFKVDFTTFSNWFKNECVIKAFASRYRRRQ